MKKTVVIAIDGHSGSGKSTLAASIAQYLGFHYLNTGKLYRYVAYEVILQKIPLTEKKYIAEIAKKINTIPLNSDIGSEKVAEIASLVASLPEVREALLVYQQNFALQSPGVVLEGRDIGETICPHADLKLFVTASLEKRAGRRYKELQKDGNSVTYNQIFSDVKQRDERDTQRSVSPLIIAHDAFLLDTTEMNKEEVYDYTVALIMRHIPSVILESKLIE